MSDTTETTTETETTTAPEGAGTETETETTESGTETEVSTEENTEPVSRADHEKQVKQLRGEAANYRTQLRDAQSKLSTAKTVEEFESATAELNTKIAELETAVLVSDVARKYNLPDDLAARLRGSTKEEPEADAEELKKYVVAPEGSTPPAHLRGGLDPEETDTEPRDPRALARKYGSRRSRR